MFRTLPKIARKIGGNKSSVSRELKKNCINGFYSPSRDQNAYLINKLKFRRKNRLKEDDILKLTITEGLKNDLSPE